MRLFEVIANAVLENRRREGPERLSLFYAVVKHAFHFRAPRIGHDRPIAQGARAELHSSLKPSDYQSIGNVLRSSPGDLVVGVCLVVQAGGLKRCCYLSIAELRT